MKIMLVEDEAMNVLLMKKMLHTFGYNDIITISRGEEAIAAYRVNMPDVVLMDIQLAGKIDGIDTTIELKKIVDRPVIYTTGYGDSETRKRAEQSGSADFLVKPIRADVLKEALSRARDHSIKC